MIKLDLQMKNSLSVIKNGIVFIGVLALLPLIALAQMSSSNYSIEADSINFGGTRSESINFGVEDTLGEVASGFSGSENYELRAGYQQLDQFPISLSTTGNVVLPAIGGISANVSTATMTATVETQNPSGYELSIRAQSSPALSSSDDSFADYVIYWTMSDGAGVNLARINKTHAKKLLIYQFVDYMILINPLSSKALINL